MLILLIEKKSFAEILIINLTKELILRENHLNNFRHAIKFNKTSIFPSKFFYSLAYTNTGDFAAN